MVRIPINCERGCYLLQTTESTAKSGRHEQVRNPLRLLFSLIESCQKNSQASVKVLAVDKTAREVKLIRKQATLENTQKQPSDIKPGDIFDETSRYNRRAESHD
jgi:hypothetical protein